MVKKYVKNYVFENVDKNLERWETKLLTVFKPMVIETGKWVREELTLFILYILLHFRFFLHKHVLLLSKISQFRFK